MMGRNRPSKATPRGPGENPPPRDQNPEQATTSPTGTATSAQATTSAPAHQHPSEAASPGRPAPRTLATGITGTNADEDAYVASEATLEAIAEWNRDWFNEISIRLWHPTRPLPEYDESELFVYYANANFNRIVRHVYVETTFPAPLDMSDSGEEASHFSMPSIARFDFRVRQQHGDLSLDELPDYETWLRGFNALAGPDALEQRPSLATLTSRLSETNRVPRIAQHVDFDEDVTIYNIQRHLQMLLEPLAPRENPSASIPPATVNISSPPLRATIGVPRVAQHANFDEDVTIYDLQRHLRMLLEPVAPRENSSVSIPPATLRATIGVPRVVQHADFDEDVTIYDLQRHLRMLSEPVAPRDRSASIPPATINAMANLSIEERVRSNGSPAVREVSPEEPTVYDVERHAFLDSVQTTVNRLRANLPWRYPQPMEVIGEITESMISSFVSQSSHGSASVSNIAAELSESSEPSQPVQPNAQDSNQMIIDATTDEDDTRSRNSPMTPPADNTLTREEAAMEPFRRSLSPVQSVHNDRVYVQYPSCFFKELPDSDDSMDEGETSQMKSNDDVSKEVAAPLDEPQMSMSPAVDDERMEVDENASNKDEEDAIIPESRDTSVLNQELDGTQESSGANDVFKTSEVNQTDESMGTDNGMPPMELDSVDMNDVLESLDDTQSSFADKIDQSEDEVRESSSEMPKSIPNVSGLCQDGEAREVVPCDVPELPEGSRRDESMESGDCTLDTAVSNTVSSRLNDTSKEMDVVEKDLIEEESDVRKDAVIQKPGNTEDDDAAKLKHANGINWNRPGYAKKAGPSNVPDVFAVDHRDDDLPMDDSEGDGEPSSSGSSSSDNEEQHLGTNQDSMPHCPTCRCFTHADTSADQVELAYREWNDAASVSMRGDGSEDGRDVEEEEQTPSADPKIARLVHHLDGLVEQCKRLMAALEAARSGDNDSLEAVQLEEAQRLAEVEALIASELDGHAAPMVNDVHERLITSSDNLSVNSIDMDEAAAEEGDHFDGDFVNHVALVDYESDVSLEPMPINEANVEDEEGPNTGDSFGHQPDFSTEGRPEFEVVPLEDDESVFNFSQLDDSDLNVTTSPRNPEPVSDASSIVNLADLESSDEETDVDNEPHRNRRNIADESSDEGRPQNRDEPMEVDSSNSSDDDDQPRRNRRNPRIVRPPNRRQRRAMPYMVPQPRRNRRSRPINLEFGQLRHIEDIEGINLPNAPPVVNMQHLFVVDNTDLSADQQVMVVNGDNFQAALYRSGHVVLIGFFDAAPVGSALLRQAREQPVVIWGNLDDPIEEIAAGANHLIMRSEAGRLYTIGQAMHGQLGVPNPQRYRQSDLRPDMLLRQVFDGFREVTFSAIRAVGNNSFAIAKNGKVYSCGQDFGDLFQ